MKKLVRITYPKLPKAVVGMQVNGKINNKDGSIANQGITSFSPFGHEQHEGIEINRTLKPTDKENATLEAEKGETVVTNLDHAGIPEFYTIGGKRHSAGGTPLNLPPDSFIFSRDRKMRLSDPEILEQFGKSGKDKNKYSFADLSKPYDNGMYRKILADPTSDMHQIKTAEQMIQNYNLKLGALALIQESTKGFPNGIPGIATPYLMKVGINPEDLMKIPGQEQELPQAKYGGTSGSLQRMPQPMYNYGGGNPWIQHVPQPLPETMPQLMMRYGGHDIPMYEPGGETDIYAPEMFANVKTHQQALDLLKGHRQANGVETTGDQQLKLTDVADQDYFDALQKYTGLSFTHTNDGDSNTWSPVQSQVVPPGPPLSDKPFTPEFRYEDGNLMQKRQGRVTGEEHWQPSNTTMANMYAKKYNIDSPFKNEQLAALTLQQKGGQALPSYQFQGEVVPQYAVAGEVLPTVDNYTSGLPDPTVEQLPNEADYINIPEGQGIRLNPDTDTYEIVDKTTGKVVGVIGGTVPKLSGKGRKYQDVPTTAALKKKGLAKWDMTKDGYLEANVKNGDWVKQDDGKWYQAKGYLEGASAYTGKKDPLLKGKFGDFGEAYGRLEQRITENEGLKTAIITEYRNKIKDAKAKGALSADDIRKAKNVKDTEILDIFFRAQKQNMALLAHKGEVELNSELFDQDRNHYVKAVKELGFEPLDVWEAGVFQGVYQGLKTVSKDPKYKEYFTDFTVDPVGKQDEPKGRISEIDGIYGNTSLGEVAMYTPAAKTNKIKMEEAAWMEEPIVEHVKNQAQNLHTPMWTQDKINMGNAALNYLTATDQKPWIAKPFTRQPRATLMSPDQGIQNILGASGQSIKAAGMFGSPQAFMANTAAMQGNAMDGVSKYIAQIEQGNVGILNQFELEKTRIMNGANQQNAQLATTLHNLNAAGNEAHHNQKMGMRGEFVKAWNTGLTNRGMTQNLNTFSDQYYIDPRTGFKHFYNPRDLNPKDPNRNQIADVFRTIKRTNPGIQDNVAYRLAKDQLGMPDNSPTGGMGIDPTMTAGSYPASLPDGYYPQG